MILLVLAAACGGAVSDASDASAGSAGNESTTTQAEGTTTSEGTEDSATETPDTTRAPSDTDTPTSDLPLAPDFTLELGTGGEYTLSSTDNPVYLVFWAEW